MNTSKLFAAAGTLLAVGSMLAAAPPGQAPPDIEAQTPWTAILCAAGFLVLIAVAMFKNARRQ